MAISDYTVGNSTPHMKTKTAMNPAIMLSLTLGMTLALLQPLSAQNLRGNAESGRRLAIHWCSGCHAVRPQRTLTFAADFADIAKQPSTTALSLRVFFRTSHHSMPNFILQPEEADDIVAYILSLKRK
jgi:mono/diheme cytochrome c family protein